MTVAGRRIGSAPHAFIAQTLTPAMLLAATMAQGPMSNIDEPRQVVVRNAAEWEMLWKEHDPASPAPPVDFTQWIVAGIFLGSRPTAGFAVEITAVRTAADRAVVEYVERQPPRGALAAQVLTSPFHLVRLARPVAAVEFRRLGP